MKGRKSIEDEEPSAASLREMPEADYSKGKWRRTNRYANAIRRGGMTIHVDGHEPRHFAPWEIGLTRNVKYCLAKPAQRRTISLPASMWKRLDARAKKFGLTPREAVSTAVARWLEGKPSEP
jgi:hypothetical protein